MGVMHLEKEKIKETKVEQKENTTKTRSNEISGVDIELIKKRINRGYSIEEAFTSLRTTNRDE